MARIRCVPAQARVRYPETRRLLKRTTRGREQTKHLFRYFSDLGSSIPRSYQSPIRAGHIQSCPVSSKSLDALRLNSSVHISSNHTPYRRANAHCPVTEYARFETFLPHDTPNSLGFDPKVRGKPGMYATSVLTIERFTRSLHHRVSEMSRDPGGLRLAVKLRTNSTAPEAVRSYAPERIRSTHVTENSAIALGLRNRSGTVPSGFLSPRTDRVAVCAAQDPDMHSFNNTCGAALMPTPPIKRTTTDRREKCL